MNDAEKLAKIKEKLEPGIFPDEKTDPQGYWMEVQTRCDNATDVICDHDLFHKQLLEIIND